MWIFWKILFTSLQLHLYLKCQSTPGFFPIYPPIIPKSRSTITRGEIKEKYPLWLGVPHVPWTTQQALRTQSLVLLCHQYLSPPRAPRPAAKAHTAVPRWLRAGQRGSGGAALAAGRRSGLGGDDGRFLLSAQAGQKSWTPPSAPGKVRGHSLAISTLNEANLVSAISRTN